jgi:hypothetical protein
VHFLSALMIAGIFWTAQAMEVCGGERVDCKENRFAAGVAVRDSPMRASTSWTNAAVVVGWACAH